MSEQTIGKPKVSMRDRWAASFEKGALYCLGREGNLAMYQSKTQGKYPTYHVWHGDDWVYCGPYLMSANEKYEELLPLAE